MGVKEDIRLNPNELDKQWADLPDQFHNYSEEGDLIESEIKFKKLELELHESDLDLKIRKKASTAAEKITETVVKSLIRVDEVWRNLNYEILELEKQRKLMASACRALEMKKEAMKNIQALYLSEFYIAPSAPEEEKSFKSHQEELVARNIRLEMKKHSRRKERSNE